MVVNPPPGEFGVTLGGMGAAGLGKTSRLKPFAFCTAGKAAGDAMPATETAAGLGKTSLLKPFCTAGKAAGDATPATETAAGLG